MSVMAMILTAGIVSGLGLLIYGGFFMKKEDEPLLENAAMESGTVAQIKQSVEEADTTLSNINSVSSLIIEEIDMKYSELLFLYQMMEEKKKDLLTQTASGVVPGNPGMLQPPKQQGIIPGVPPMSAPPVQLPGAVPQSAQAMMKTNQELQAIGKKMDEVKQFPKIRNQQEVLGLRQKGYDVTEIAKMLGIGKGEVSLILDLSRVGAKNGK